jgi:hypothetical protein
MRQAALGVDNPDVVISQVYGGGANTGAPLTHDYIELFNRSSAPVSLEGWSLQYASATGSGNFGASSAQLTELSGTIGPGQYFLVQEAGGAAGVPPLPPVALPAPDLIDPTPILMSATAGKVALVQGATTLGCNGGSTPCDAETIEKILDLVGYGGANFFEGSAPAPTLSNTTAAFRQDDGCIDTNNNGSDFTTASPAPRNSATAPRTCGGDAAPTVSSTSPASGGSVPPAAALAVTFSEPVAAADGWFALSCDAAPVPASGSGGPTTFTITPSAPLVAGASCLLVIEGTLITDLDGVDPPDQMDGNVSIAFTVEVPPPPTRIRDIQGTSHLSPKNGQTVNDVTGVVTLVQGNGFFLQDPSPDAIDATSEGIFVFTSSAPTVAVGDAVLVTGLVTEFRPGCTPSCSPTSSAFSNLTTTEINRPTRITLVSSGNALPAAIVLGAGAGERLPPSAVIDDDTSGSVETGPTSFDPAHDGIDFYESLEGMRVQLDDAAAVGPTVTFSSGSREIAVVGRGGDGAGPRTARGGVVVGVGDFNPERLIVVASTLPLVDVGATFPGALRGVIDYSFGNFKLLPTEVPAPVASPLVPEVVSLGALGANEVDLATFNVENLDANDPPEKFARLAEIVVNNLRSPDLIAVEEIQDDNGATNDANTNASLTYAALINAIATAGGPTYKFRNIDPEDDRDGGEPGGNIRVGFLFRDDRGLSFVDKPGAVFNTPNAVINEGGLPALQYSPGRVDPTNAAFNNSRKPLAAELRYKGRALFVFANHFNSKGGDQPLFGRFQPPALNSETQRRAQAEVLADFVAQILAVDPTAAVVVLGDLNDFEFSAPVGILKAAGLTTLVETLPANERYTYVFDGNSQVLDHIMVSSSLVPVARFDIVHVNAEFADPASDHDPSVARLSLPVAKKTSPVLECVVHHDGGGYTARFGYSNPNAFAVSIPLGTNNRFHPAPTDRGQPTVFLAGRQRYVFEVPFTAGNQVWILNGKTSTASSNPVQRCAQTTP